MNKHWDTLAAMGGEQPPAEHEMTCPNCNTTIRSRLADTADRAELERLRARVEELEPFLAVVPCPNPTEHEAPVASNVRGAADWLLYFYAEPKHQGEDDQTGAAYWALGDDLTRKLIDAFTELSELRARDEAAKDVVAVYEAGFGTKDEILALRDALDALARAHDPQEQAMQEVSDPMPLKYGWPSLDEEEAEEERAERRSVGTSLLAAESAAIVNSGQCRCTEDESCWEHEALEMRAEHEGGGQDR